MKDLFSRISDALKEWETDALKANPDFKRVETDIISDVNNATQEFLNPKEQAKSAA